MGAPVSAADPAQPVADSVRAADKHSRRVDSLCCGDHGDCMCDQQPYNVVQLRPQPLKVTFERVREAVEKARRDAGLDAA